MTSSGLGAVPIPGNITYSASKSFSSFLAQGLNFELKDKIDVISFELGRTDTKMSKATNRKGLLSPEKVV